MRHIPFTRVFLVAWLACAGQICIAAAADIDILTPLVNDQTLAVVSVGLNEPIAGGQPQHNSNPMVDDLLKGQPQWVIAALDKTEEWNDRLWAAGCRRVLLVGTLAYLPPISFDYLDKLSPTYDPRGYWPRMAFVALPGVTGREVEKLRSNIEALGATAPADDEWHTLTCREIKGVAVVGIREVLERLEKDQPTSRPEFAKAFEAVGDWSLRAALVPPPIFARAAEQILSDPFPGVETSLGRVLARGIQWIGFAQDTKTADEPYRLVIQSAGNADAQSLLNLMRAGAIAAWLELTKGNGLDAAAAIQSLLPSVQQDRLVLESNRKQSDAAWRLVERRMAEAASVRVSAQSLDQLKQIGLALHNFHARNKHFPEPAIRDKDGKPLLSWRVAILPMLEQQSLYDQFHLDEPWDSEHNKPLLAKMPEVFRDTNAEHPNPGKTRFIAAIGERLAFTPGQAHSVKDFTDGTSKTLLAVEADAAHAIEWTRPDDMPINLDNPRDGLAAAGGRFAALFADGSVRPIAPSVPPDVLRWLFMRDDSHWVDPSSY